MLSGDELISGLGTQVEDLLSEEGIGQRVVRQEDDLSSAGGK